MTADLQVREDALQLAHLPTAKRLLVVCALFASIGQVTASKVEERVLTPGLAEDRDTARTQNAPQFPAGDRQTEMVQNRITPGAVEVLIREGQSLAVGLNVANRDAIGPARSCASRT